jgi:prevent-host-death family protein
MIDFSKDIRSLSEFKRNSSALLDQMEQSGRPVVLTVNGKAKLVVQDATSYQKLIDALDYTEAVGGIRRGLDDVKHGRTQPTHEAFSDIRGRAHTGRKAKR